MAQQGCRCQVSLFVGLAGVDDVHAAATTHAKYKTTDLRMILPCCLISIFYSLLPLFATMSVSYNRCQIIVKS